MMGVLRAVAAAKQNSANIEAAPGEDSMQTGDERFVVTAGVSGVLHQQMNGRSLSGCFDWTE